MAVTYETSLDRVLTTNEVSGFTDVVKFVQFTITFFDSDYADKNSDGKYKWCTEAGVEVYIDIDSLDADTFIAFADVTQKKICEWAFTKQGGNDYINNLLDAYHKAHLERILGDRLCTEQTISDITKE
tara:strand:+ start:1066 stop:1449 length:384 start_codon:yes stop_codon:yes gene_type:complete